TDPRQPRALGRVAVDVQGNMYVFGGGSQLIPKLSPAGELLAQWGAAGRGPGQFEGSGGIAVGRQGNGHGAGLGDNRVQKPAPTGEPLAQWGRESTLEGSAPGQFHLPEGVAVDGEGNVYVADTHNDRVQKLSPAGEPLAQWGGRGAAPGQFLRPR